VDLPMTAHPSTWMPVESCTLPTSQQPLRVAEFDNLFAASLRAVEHPRASGAHARLVPAGDETPVARVQRLVDAETACCSFFTFTLTPLDADQARATVVALDITVPAERSDVLAAVVQRADQARRAAS
jgi:hypothetical protein